MNTQKIGGLINAIEDAGIQITKVDWCYSKNALEIDVKYADRERAAEIAQAYFHEEQRINLVAQGIIEEA